MNLKFFTVFFIALAILNSNTALTQKYIAVTELQPDMGTLKTNGLDAKDYTNIEENITSVFNRIYSIPEGKTDPGLIQFRIPTQDIEDDETLKNMELIITVITGGDRDYVGSHAHWQFSIAIGGEEFPITLGIDEFGTQDIKMFESNGEIWIKRTWIIDLSSTIDILYIRDLKNRLLINFYIQPWGDQYYIQNPREGSGWDRPFFINKFALKTEYETSDPPKVEQPEKSESVSNKMILITGYVGFLILLFFCSFFLFRSKNELKESMSRAGKKSFFKY